jgi:hypothetical protein
LEPQVPAHVSRLFEIIRTTRFECGAEGLLTRLGCHSFRATGITSICSTAASSSTRSRSAAPLFVPRHVGRRESSAVYSPGGADFKLPAHRVGQRKVFDIGAGILGDRSDALARRRCHSLHHQRMAAAKQALLNGLCSSATESNCQSQTTDLRCDDDRKGRTSAAEEKLGRPEPR